MKREDPLKLVERLIELVPDDEDLAKRARHLGALIRWPMRSVLDKVPGSTVKERAGKLGISRQAYYGWINGTYRPNAKQAKRLEQLTGIAASDIRGVA
jgi:transcriptional regulator with XRE-family HTH domain